ncbi:MAG: GMP synthase, partial [Porticoccaceae bacterium]|nr:GMP synthase [Porticoccaceae bacterium]
MILRIGILRTDDVRPELAEEFGEYPEMFESLFLSANQTRPVNKKLEMVFTTYLSNQGELPKDIDEQDAYLITGSKTGVYDEVPWIQPLSQFVQRCHQNEKKLIGICFGHQLVAHALGGLAAKADQGWKIGVIEAFFNPNSHAKFSSEGSFQLLYSHQDQVIEPATGSLVVASTPECPVAMTTLGNHILTFQGHPEFSHEYASSLFQLRQEVYPLESFNQA